MAELRNGSFYEFDRSSKGNEIRGTVSRNAALERLRKKKNIYTPQRSDAKSLAKDVQKGKADQEGAHEADFYAHYHPAGNHDDYGHVFFGERGLKHQK